VTAPQRCIVAFAVCDRASVIMPDCQVRRIMGAASSTPAVKSVAWVFQ
jgi:hypothetical protein